MLIPTFLVLLLTTLSLRVRCDEPEPAAAAAAAAAAPQPEAPSTPPTTPPVPVAVYNPVDLNKMCQDPANYCIYVDQIRPGTVRASPVNATDDQGGFLFERKAYAEHPFHVCYGGCCIDLDFAKRPGCVTMRYVSRSDGEGRGHLLARFADNKENLLGPRSDMRRLLEACPQQDGPLPYVVIGARAGREGKDGQQQQQQAVDPAQGQQEPDKGVQLVDNSHTPPAEVSAAAPVNSQRNHDYFDDVTVPLADGW